MNHLYLSSDMVDILRWIRYNSNGQPGVLSSKILHNDCRLISGDNPISFIAPSIDVPGQLSYLDSSRYAAIDSDGCEFWTSKRRYRAKAGKVFRRVLTCLEIEFNDQGLSELAEAYARYVSIHHVGDIPEVEYLKGEDVRWGYHEENHASDSGTLGSSCMRYERCQSYFDIYVENPDTFTLAVIKVDGKIAARCIVYEGKYYSRIYYISDAYRNHMVNHFESKGMSDVYNNNDGPQFFELDKYEFEEYPYMDTYQYLDGHKLNVDEDGIELSCTGGGYSGGDTILCDCCGYTYHEDDVIYSEIEEEHLCANCSNPTVCGGYVSDSNSDYMWCDDVEAYAHYESTGNHIDGTIVYLGFHNYVYIESYDAYADDEDCVPVGYVYELTKDCVKLHDGEWSLKEDATELSNGEYALDHDVITDVHGNLTIEEYCTDVDGVWVQDSSLDEYLAEQQGQLAVELA